jgi:F0F1-type ATP synthase epsilon subunit
MSPLPDILHVSIVNQDEQVWDGEAESVSSENSAGNFDILPQHANFVSIIKNKPITIQTVGSGSKTVLYKNAVIVVKDNVVKIFIDI